MTASFRDPPRAALLSTIIALVLMAAILAGIVVGWRTTLGSSDQASTQPKREGVAFEDPVKFKPALDSPAAGPLHAGEEQSPGEPGGGPLSARVGSVDNRAPAGPGTSTSDPTRARTRSFDASEGTKLDPLKNTTYDLTSPKNVPVLDRESALLRRERSPAQPSRSGPPGTPDDSTSNAPQGALPEALEPPPRNQRSGGGKKR